MRVLLCSPIPPVSDLGAPKVLIELAQSLRAVGCDCDIHGPEQLGLAGPVNLEWRREYSRRLAEFVRGIERQYDVVDYDHLYLPFPRSEFAPDVLMVARSVLLVHHMDRIPLPRRRAMMRLVGALRDSWRRREQSIYVSWADRCISEADLVNVSNDHDSQELTRRGVCEKKILVLPFGLTARRRDQFEATCFEAPPAGSWVAFVGTFDYRKGANDFPGLVRRVCAEVPSARFHLLGTCAMFKTADEVLGFFPRDLRDRVKVRPAFEPDELPRLLSECAVGVFPSYYEGFGFGVLEMLAAAIPVIAYDAPGPPMMLPAEQLVPPGDVALMSRKVIELLKDRRKLISARKRARELSRPFDWSDIARRTIDAYASAHARLGQVQR